MQNISEVLSIQNISKLYGKGEATIKALDNVSLTFKEGAFTTISGPSGSGKSTLLNILGLLIQPSSGQIYFQGKPITIKDFDEFADFRLHKIGFIFQAFNLIPVLSARENVLLPLMIRKDISESEKSERASYLLEAVGLSDRADQRPDQLSGGQKQRVAVARALVCRPPMVLADEPTANLDSESSEIILQMMKKMNEAEGTAFIFSTHDPRIEKYAKEKIVIKDGKIAESHG